MLAEKNLRRMDLEEATDLVFATEASLPEDEVLDWVLKLVLFRLLNYTTADARS